MGFVNDDDVSVRPVATLCQCLRAGDLVRHFRIAAPVVRLHDAVCCKSVGVCRLAGLVDQGRAVAQENHLSALHQRLMRDAVAQVRLARTGRGHDELVLVAFPEPLAQRFMRGLLERARIRERRACVIGRIVKQARHDGAHASAFNIFSSLAIWRSRDFTSAMASLQRFM